MRRNFNQAWMAVGHFNAVTGMDEVSNPDSFRQRRCSGFKEWIFEEGMIDLGYTGNKYTWMRGRDRDSFKGARLDRAMGTTEWLSMFPEISVHHLPIFNSNHAPVLVRLKNKSESKKYGFKFQAAWLTHPEFTNKVRELWNDEETTSDNNKRIAPMLMDWNRRCFGNIHKRKKHLLARLEGIQKAMEIKHHNGLIKLDYKLRRELDETLYQEELLWFQQSREEWIRSGDRNTRFYHAATMIKKARRKAFQLKESDGGSNTNQGDIKDRVREYFESIFTEENSNREVGIMRGDFPVIGSRIWDEVNR